MVHLRSTREIIFSNKIKKITLERKFGKFYNNFKYFCAKNKINMTNKQYNDYCFIFNDLFFQLFYKSLELSKIIIVGLGKTSAAQ